MVMSVVVVAAQAQNASNLLRPTIEDDNEATGAGSVNDPIDATLPRRRPNNGNSTINVFDAPLDDDIDPVDGDLREGVDTRDRRRRRDQNATDNQLLGDQLDGSAGNIRARRADPVGLIDATGNVTPLANTPAVPIQQNTVTADPTPYSALGIRTGSLLWFPVLTQSIGHTNNADFAADGRSSVFSQTDLRLTFQSDWAVHELRGDLGLSYQRFFNGSTENLPSGDGNAQLRLDAADGVAATLGVDYSIATESASSDNLSTTPGVFVTNRPIVKRYGGFAEIARNGGRLSASLRGTVSRTDFEDADLNGGGTLSQRDRNNTLVSATARVGYETSQAVQPFVQATYGQRKYDEGVDRNGNQRDSTVYDIRGGITFDLGEKLNGEIAIGYGGEKFDDPQLSSLSGLTVNGTLIWSPKRLTTVTATAQTSFNGSTNINENGSITYAGSVSLARDIRPNFTLTASLLGSLVDYDTSNREDLTGQVQIGAEWRFNRSLALIGSAGYEWVDSTDANASYDAATVRLGLRLQR